MKKLIYSFSLFALFGLLPLVSEAQTAVINGPTTSALNGTQTYTVTLFDANNNQVFPIGGSFSWTPTFGTVTSSNRSQASIQWTSYGTAYVEYTFENFGDFYYGIFYVGVIVPNPVSTFSFTYSCSNTLVTRNSNPPSGVDWYWQTSSSGTSTSLGTGASINRTTTDALYLRSRSQSDGSWSPDVLTVTSFPVYSTPTNGGTIGSSATICPSTSPGTLVSTLNGSGGDGNVTYQWQQSPDNTDNSKWVNVPSPNGTSVNYAPGPISSKTYYQRVATTICGTNPSNTVTIDTYPALTNAGSISGAATICYNGNATLTGTTAGTTNFQWYQNGTAIPNSNSQSYTAIGLTAPTNNFNRVAIGPCGTLDSNTITITVNPQLNAGSIGGTQTICSGSSATATNVTSPSGGTGSYSYQWQSSPDNNISSPWSNIPGATAITYTSTFSNPSTPTTYLRRNVSSCGSASSSSILISADATSNGGTLNSSASVFTSFTGTLTLSGNTGTIVKWQQRIGSGNWTDIANTLTTYNLSNITTTTSYRVDVKNGTCTDALSSEALITINPTPVITASASRITLGPVTLSTGSYSSYTWKDANGTTVSTSQTLSTGTAGDYTVAVTLGGASGLSPVFHLPGQLEGLQQNYIVTNTILKNNVVGSLDVSSLSVDDLTQTVQYFDGIGRPLQTIVTQGSPLKKDIVQPVQYDIIGREANRYLPYASSENNGQFKVNAISDQYGFYQAGGLVATDTQPYSITTFESSPINRAKTQTGPGVAWSGHAAGNDYLVNSSIAENVIAWRISGSTKLPIRMPVTTGYVETGGFYATGQLTIKSTSDENGNETREYTDKDGHLILRKILANKNASTALTDTATWTQTYYIYDNVGLLRYVLQPQLVNKLVKSGGNPSSDDLKEFAYQYKYDSRKRMIQKQVPGAKPMQMVYDKRDRLVMTQDAEQLNKNQWLLTKYDAFNRPVITAIYNSATPTVDDTNFYEVYNGTPASHGYTANVVPVTGYTVLTASYYDNHKFVTDLGITADCNPVTSDISGQAAIDERVDGQLTGVKLNVIDTTEYLYKVTYYDNRYRAVQSVSQISYGGSQRTTNLYDFSGRILQTKTTQNKTGSSLVKTLRKTTYDHASRPVKVYMNVNDEPNDQLVAQYNYNELGQMVKKNLHLLYDADTGPGGSNTPDYTVATQYKGESDLFARNRVVLSPNYIVTASSTPYRARVTAETQAQAETVGKYMQSVDYQYNIRGWLTSINDAALTDANDYFGMELVYNELDILGNTPMFNGNISAIKWKNAGTATGLAGQRSYKFGYDSLNRMKTATFQASSGTTSIAWDKEVNTLNESVKYYSNGNIQSLKRNQNLVGLIGTTVTSTSQTIDNLTYTYGAGNQLKKVEDSGGTTAGFNNGSSDANEYTYDDNGSMNKDLNKNVTSITYNPLNKVEKVLFADGHYIIYRYDATGTKLAMITYNSDNSVRVKNEYAEGFVYVHKALSFFGSPEGRVVPNNVLPAGQAGSTEYQYTITDHLGNTRVLFTSAKPVAQSVTATFEGDSNDQSSQFTNVTPVVVSFSAANNTPGGNKVVRLNQDNPVGPGYSKKVYPGDKVDLMVFSYYEATSGYGTSTVSLSGMISVVTGALVGVGPDPGGLKANGVNSALKGFGIGANQGDTQPAAFLNYILFDANYKVMDAGWQVVPATSFLKQKMNMPTITVKEAGYIFAYLSYEDQSTNFVYFDDFKVTVTPTNILQSNEYYPFGMQTAKSWTRENTTNNFLYNGKELQTDADWYDYDARMYMPEIGRWGVVDPLTEKSRRWSPYTYAMDNPVRFIDPDGMEVTETDRGGLLYDGDDIAPVFSKILASLPNEEPDDRDTKSEKDDDQTQDDGDIRKQFYDLVSAKNYPAALGLVVNAYSLDAKVKGSYSFKFDYDSREVLLTTEGALGKAQTINIRAGALEFTSFETMIHLVNHEFIHVDQRANLMMDNGNEREFLAYYNNLYSYPSLPGVTQYIIDNDTSKAVMYYNRLSAEQKNNYSYPYSNLNH